MKIFLDVDNTILEHYGFYSYKTESRVHKSMAKFPKENVDAIRHMFQTSICHDPITIKNLLMHHNTYILTKYNDLSYEIEKRRKLAEIFDISVEELMNLKDIDGNPKYIAVAAEDSKVEIVKQTLKVSSIEDFILVDDYSQNIIEWEYAGGIGFKYYNQYNSTQHPTNGFSISNFKIFDYYIKNTSLGYVFISGHNKYKLKYFVDAFLQKPKSEVIDVSKVIYSDIKNRFDFDDIYEHNKYSHSNFFKDYYYFLEDIKPGYINELISRQITNREFRIITSTFESNMSGIMSLVNKNIQGGISLAINSQHDIKTSNIYDVYLTISEERFLDDVEIINMRISKLLKKMLIHN